MQTSPPTFTPELTPILTSPTQPSAINTLIVFGVTACLFGIIIYMVATYKNTQRLLRDTTNQPPTSTDPEMQRNDSTSILTLPEYSPAYQKNEVEYTNTTSTRTGASTLDTVRFTNQERCTLINGTTLAQVNPPSYDESSVRPLLGVRL